MHFPAVAAIAAAAVCLSSCIEKVVRAERPDASDIAAAESVDVFTALRRTQRCAVFVRALELTGLGDVLFGTGPFTLLAPTDEAFDALGEGRLDYLMKHPRELEEVLLRHVVAARIPVSELAWSRELVTIEGRRLPVASEGNEKFVGDARVIEADIPATNGIIHLVDALVYEP